MSQPGWLPVPLPCLLPGPYGHYEVYREMPVVGGQGVVYKAADYRDKDQRNRAIKFLRVPAHLDEFLREAYFGQRCRSEHLSPTLDVLDLRKHNGWPPVALVMDYYS